MLAIPDERVRTLAATLLLRLMHANPKCVASSLSCFQLLVTPDRLVKSSRATSILLSASTMSELYLTLELTLSLAEIPSRNCSSSRCATRRNSIYSQTVRDCALSVLAFLATCCADLSETFLFQLFSLGASAAGILKQILRASSKSRGVTAAAAAPAALAV